MVTPTGGSGSGTTISGVYFASCRTSNALTTTFSDGVDIVYIMQHSSDISSNITPAILAQYSVEKGSSVTIDSGTITLSADGKTLTKPSGNMNFLAYIGIKY